MNTFTIMSQPFYDQYNQCYKNVLMVNAEPAGPIRKITRRTIMPRLSPFQVSSACNPIQKCGLVLQSLRNDNEYYSGCCKLNSGCNLMTPDEIPDLISFLLANNYQIESQLTNMLNIGSITPSNRKLNFMVTYYDKQQPNITYIR